MRSTRRVFQGLLIACSLALAATFAYADPNHPTPEESERAHQLFMQSKPLHDAKKFADAERVLTEAWALHHSPDIAANLGLTEAAMNKHRVAAEHLSFAIKHMIAGATPEQRAKINKAFDIVKREVSTVRVIVEPSGAELTLDGSPLGKAPLDDDVFVEPGDRLFSATANGFTAREEKLDAKKGEVHSLILKLEKAPEPTSNTYPGAGPTASQNGKGIQGDGDQSSTSTGGISTKTIAMIAEGAVAVIGLSVGIGFMVAKQNAADERDTLRDESVKSLGKNGCSAQPDAQVCMDLRDADDRMKKDRTISTIGFVGFGVGLAALGATYFLWPERERQGARVGIDPFRRTVVVGGTF